MAFLKKIFPLFFIGTGTVVADENWTTEAQPNLMAEIENAEPLTVENVSQPTQTIRHESPFFVANADGTPDIVVVFYKGYQGPGTVFATDTNTGETTRAEVPRGRNVHLQGRATAANGKFFTTLQLVGGGLELWVYDPKTNQFSARETFGKEDLNLMGQGNRLALGPDGKIVGAVGARANGQAGFYEIDPETETVTVLGTGGSIKGSTYVRGLAVGSNGKILAVYGDTPRRLIEFDPATTSSRQIATANPRGKISIQTGEVTTFLITQAESGVETDGEYRIEADGELTRIGDAGSKKGDEEKSKKSGGDGGGAKTDRMAEFRKLVAEGMSPKDAKQKILGKVEGTNSASRKKGGAGGMSRTGGLEIDASKIDPSLNADRRGLLKYRAVGAEEWQVAAFDPPLYSEALIQVSSLPDGRIFGTATNRAGHFVYDPKSDETTFLGRTGLQHHSSAISGNHIFISGYPSSLVWSWDFSGTSWTEPKRTKMGAGNFGTSPETDNPRQLGTLRDFSGVHMATCSAVDSQGRVYFSGRWYRDGKGGGLGWWDPAKQEAGGFWESLSHLQVADCCAVGDGRWVVLSTVPVFDPVLGRDRVANAPLCVIDTEKNPGEIARKIVPIPEAASTGLIAPAGKNRLIGIAPDPNDETTWLIYGVNIETGEAAFTKKIPALPVTKVSATEMLHSYRNSLALAPDGMIWMKHFGVLLKIDPADAGVEVVGRPVIGEDALEGLKTMRDDEREMIRKLGMLKADGAPATIGRMTFSGDDLYLTGTPWLRRIRGVR